MSVAHLLVGDWLEGFNHKFDGYVVVAIVYMFGVGSVNIQRPLAKIYYFIFKTWEFAVTEVLSKFINAFFGEDCLYEIKTIWDENLWDHFQNKASDRSA